MFSNLSITTKEEAHWISFRSAVVGLQDIILSEKENSSSSPLHHDDRRGVADTIRENNANKNDFPLSKAKGYTKHKNGDDGEPSLPADDKNNFTRQTPPTHSSNVCIIPETNREDHTQSKHQSDSWDGRSIETETEAKSNQPHQQLELIGLEKVNNNSGLDENNNHNIDGIVGSGNGNSISSGVNLLMSPLNAPSHASQTTNALSIAEQQLAETKLKLAMTESERDELEFQLMQQNS